MYNICMGRLWVVINNGKLKIGIVFPGDHNPPHVHIKFPGADAKINIKNQKVVKSKGFSKKAVRDLKKLVRENKKKLLDKWEDFYGKEE